MNISKNFKHNFLLKYIPKRTKLLYIFVYSYRENDLKRPSTYIILFYTKKSIKKISMQNLIKIYTKTHHVCTLFLSFLAGKHGP